MQTKQSKAAKGANKPGPRKRRVGKSPQGTPVPKPSLVTTSRTLATTQNSLRKLNASTEEGVRSWPMCRLQPWSGGSGALLPDGSGDPRTVSDFYAFTDITIGAGMSGFSLATIPALPYNALFRHDSGSVTLNGSGFAGGAPNNNGGVFAVTYGATNTLPWVPINATKAASSLIWEDTLSGMTKSYIPSDKARVTSMGWRLLYTGPSSTCSGLVTVTSTTLRTDPSVPKTIGRITQAGANGSQGNIIDCSAKPVRILPINLSGAALNAGKDTVVARPETTLKGVVRHSAPVYQWKDMAEQPMLMVQWRGGRNYLLDDMEASCASFVNAAGVAQPNWSTVANGGIYFIDEDWDSTNIQVSGASGSYRFETWMCVEYVPHTNTAYYDMSRVVNQAETKVVDITNKTAASLKVATPTS